MASWKNWFYCYFYCLYWLKIIRYWINILMVIIRVGGISKKLPRNFIKSEIIYWKWNQIHKFIENISLFLIDFIIVYKSLSTGSLTLGTVNLGWSTNIQKQSRSTKHTTQHSKSGQPNIQSLDNPTISHDKYCMRCFTSRGDYWIIILNMLKITNA